MNYSNIPITPLAIDRVFALNEDIILGFKKIFDQVKKIPKKQHYDIYVNMPFFQKLCVILSNINFKSLYNINCDDFAILNYLGLTPIISGYKFCIAFNVQRVEDIFDIKYHSMEELLFKWNCSLIKNEYLRNNIFNSSNFFQYKALEIRHYYNIFMFSEELYVSLKNIIPNLPKLPTEKYKDGNVPYPYGFYLDCGNENPEDSLRPKLPPRPKCPPPQPITKRFPPNHPILQTPIPISPPSSYNCGVLPYVYEDEEINPEFIKRTK